MVCYQAYAMGRMKFVWGNDAEVFRPERWLDGDGKFQPESPFKFTAFQVGKLEHFEIDFFMAASVFSEYPLLSHSHSNYFSGFAGRAADLSREGVCEQADEDLLGRAARLL